MRIHFEYPFKTNDIFEIKDNFARFSHVKSNLLFSDCAIDSPEVSIVIPTYKNPETIFDAIESAINQEEAPLYEIIVVNNNPEENSDFIDMLHDLNSQKISYYLNEENIGLFGNWNRCVELARSTQIVFLHADDILCKDALKTLWELHTMVESDAAILGFHNSIDKNKTVIHTHQTRRPKFFGLLKAKKYYKLNKLGLFNQDVSNGCGAMFNKGIIKRIGGWNSDLYPTADACFCMLYQMNSSIYRVDKATFYSRIGFNESCKVGKLYPACDFFIRNKIVDLFFYKNRLLKKIIYLNSISINFEPFGINRMKKLNVYEKLLLSLNSKIYNLIRYYI